MLKIEHPEFQPKIVRQLGYGILREKCFNKCCILSSMEDKIKSFFFLLAILPQPSQVSSTKT